MGRERGIQWGVEEMSRRKMEYTTTNNNKFERNKIKQWKLQWQ